jgi:hypothetical protein
MHLLVVFLMYMGHELFKNGLIILNFDRRLGRAVVLLPPLAFLGMTASHYSYWQAASRCYRNLVVWLLYSSPAILWQ